MSAAMSELAANPSRRNTLGRIGAEAVKNTYNRKAYQEAYCNMIEELFQAETRTEGAL